MVVDTISATRRSSIPSLPPASLIIFDAMLWLMCDRNIRPSIEKRRWGFDPSAKRERVRAEMSEQRTNADFQWVLDAASTMTSRAILTGVLDLPDRERQGGGHCEAHLMHEARQYDELAERVDVRLEDVVREDHGGVAVQAGDAHDGIHQRVHHVIDEAFSPAATMGGRRGDVPSFRNG
jgi:hypothetical protein